MIDLDFFYPQSHEDIVAFHDEFLRNPVNDGYQDNEFTFNQLKSGIMSYSFYNVKAFEFETDSKGVPKLNLDTSIVRKLFPERNLPAKKNYHTVPNLPHESWELVIQHLRCVKDDNFRALGEPFACCNSFEKCSDALACLHKEDCFYNGCLYRRNLEQGRIFYGKNKNI